MRCALLLLPLLAGLGRAQELRWGMHALGSTTTKDLAQATDDATGFGLGVHALISDSAANALRLRLEGQAFPGKETAGLRTRVYEVAFTTDWLHYFSGRTETGPYTVLSAGISHWRTELDVPAQPALPTDTENRSCLIASGGLGWQLSRTFGLEAQAWWADRFRRDTGKAQGIMGMLTIRF
jgi:hypothetical protein